MYEQFLLLHIITCLLWIIPGCGLLVAWYGCIITHQNQQRERQLYLINQIIPGTAVTTTSGQQGIVLVVLQHSVIIENPNGEKIEIFKHALSTSQNN
jgi:preprotein translocase YajC subunit